MAGDARAEVVTRADAGGGPHVRVLRYDPAALGGLAPVWEFFASSGGGRVAADHVLGLVAGQIVTGAGPGGGPHAGVLTPTGAPLGGFLAS